MRDPDAGSATPVRTDFRPPTPDGIPHDPATVNWRRVGLFVLIAWGGAAVVGFGVAWAARALPSSMLGVLTVSLAVIYMPLPLVAGLIVERRAGRRPLLVVRAWRAVRQHPGRILWIFLLGMGAALAVSLVTLLIALGLAAAGVPGAGTIITTTAQLAEHLGQMSGTAIPAEAAAALPPVWVLAALSLIQGVIAGATLNAVFAFGEEYGWRGVLAEELAPLGVLRSNLIIGIVWGLWHVPLIVGIGYNYGEHWLAGIGLMVTFCVPLGFVLAWVAARAGVFGAAVGHGVINGTISITMIVLTGTSTVIVPVGIAVALGGTIVAVVLWLLFPPNRPAPRRAARAIG